MRYTKNEVSSIYILLDKLVFNIQRDCQICSLPFFLLKPDGEDGWEERKTNKQTKILKYQKFIKSLTSLFFVWQSLCLHFPITWDLNIIPENIRVPALFPLVCIQLSFRESFHPSFKKLAKVSVSLLHFSRKKSNFQQYLSNVFFSLH